MVLFSVWTRSSHRTTQPTRVENVLAGMGDAVGLASSRARQPTRSPKTASLALRALRALQRLGAFGPPMPELLGQLVQGSRGNVVGGQTAHRLDGGPHLAEVGRTVWAGAQVCVEAPALGTRHRPFEVVGHQLDDLLAHQLVSASKS